MKRIVSLTLCLSMILSLVPGCSNRNSGNNHSSNTTLVTSEAEEDSVKSASQSANVEVIDQSLPKDNQFGREEIDNASDLDEDIDIQFTGMSDKKLVSYIEDSVYTKLVRDLNSSDYYVERVSAVYVSQEYLQELAYNSQANVFFGYSLAELDAYFEGTRYVFTLGNDGQTTVEALKIVKDATYDQILKNVAIGTGVILICVTVSTVTAGLGAPAVSLIFAVAAKTGAICALSGSLISGVSSAVVKGYQTGDISEALKAGALGASEGYKWGAISGALMGGAGEAWGLYSATGNGLTMNQVATIQQESGYPLSIIRQFHTVQEYEVFKGAGLQAEMVGGKLALVRSDIDLYSVVDEYGRNNFTRLSQGLNPIDGSRKAFQWHHIGQNNDATLALLTSGEHASGGLHGYKIVSEIDRIAFNEYKKEILNKALLKYLLNGAI